jgi:hypothetical protein
MKQENNQDDVVESLGNAVLDYSRKGTASDEAWLNGDFAKDASIWGTDAERQKDASDIIEMTDAFDRERDAYDAARAEGTSSAKYLMGRIDSALAESGADNPAKAAREIYSSVMEDGKGILKEIGLDAAQGNEEAKDEPPEWNDESKGGMAKEMSGVFSSRGVITLGDLSDAVVTAADKRLASGSDGDSDITDYVERQSRERSCKGLAIPMSAAIVKCARKGMLGKMVKKVPADAITAATCVASEGVKTLVRVGKGEMTLDEGREKMAETVHVAAGAYIGKKAGEKAGAYVGGLVGSLFGPVGAAVGTTIGTRVGAFVGHKVGKVVGKVVYKVGQVFRKARNWVREKIGSGLRTVGRAISRCFRAIFG